MKDGLPMPDVKKTKVVPYTPAQMYALVNDVKRYSEFVPWCHRSELLSENEDELRARLHFSGGGFEKSFTTCNRLQKDKMIELRLVDGPFRHLEGFWRFDQHGEGGCQIVLDLEFEFSNKLLSLAFGPFFHQAANSLVDAFSKRAEEIYA
jgi:ribosome-associated toxin RatA of RatAB toxin-antitoxin module